jgi:DNA-directed RNA polymerase subunit RPC12/RpoP
LDFESGEGYIYDMFEAVFDVVHGKKPKKLKFAKCMNCSRLNPFRPKSKGTQFTAIRCNNCGGTISFGARGKESRISEHAQIFCENCEDDCTQCPINKQTSILFQENVASNKKQID